MNNINTKTPTWSLTIDQIVRQLDNDASHNCGSRIRILRQGNWEIMLTGIPQDKNNIEFYVMKHKSKTTDFSQSEYVQLYKQDGYFGTLSMGKLPKFVTQKIISVAKALEKRGYSIIIKQNLFTR